MKHAKLISILLVSLVLVISPSYPVAMAKIDAKKSDVQNDNNIIPSVKLIYGKKSYEMLPFIVVKDQKTEKLNFPDDADGGDPSFVKIPSTDTINFEFSSTPREKSAYLIDYDADSYEISQLNKVDENKFSFTNYCGIKTLEVRAIYSDGTYVTYTILISILDPAQPSKIFCSSLKSNPDKMSNLNYNNIGSSKSGLSSSQGTQSSLPMTTEERILQEYSKIVRLDNYKKDPANIESGNNNNIALQGGPENGGAGISSSTLADIPITTIVSNKKEAGNQVVSQNNELSWMKLDLGQQRQISGLKIEFAEPTNVNFFTMSFSNDGTSYSSPEYLANTGASSTSEIFIPQDAPVTARYIKVNQLAGGGINSDWITSIKALGVP